jgi:gluconokinase
LPAARRLGSNPSLIPIMANPPPSLAFLIMGVSGSGKTTVGERLAKELGWTFRDADDFHPPANVAKMSAGQPLTDADRAPWLAAIRAYLVACLARNENTVVTCSALKEEYRRDLIVDPVRIKLVYLSGDFALIERRLKARKGHFMKPAMLESQFATLEPPKAALTLDIADPPGLLVARIRRTFKV